MPSKKTVLVHDSDNFISIHTRTGFTQPVMGAASPEEAVQELLQTHPPSAISTTYILPGDATSDVLKRTLTAFKDANYPNIKMVETFSYMLTAMLDGTDCEYDEGETILYYHYDRLMESLDKGFSIVLKKVDQLFEIVEHIGNNVHEVLNYYPEIKKVIISSDDRKVVWNMVIADKNIVTSKPKIIQHKYAFDDYLRVKPITGIKILINDGAKLEPLNLFYESIPVTKTIELTIPPQQHAIFMSVSHGLEPYIPDSSHEFTSRPGYMAKVAITVSIDETILPRFSYRVVAYIPQVMTEIVFDSNTGKYSGNLVKTASQKNIVNDCTIPDDVFAAFESLPTTGYHVGIIINYKDKFDMIAHKAIMSLIPEHTKVWIIPLHTALKVDIRHSKIKIADEKVHAIWYHNTNSEVFYIEKSDIAASEADTTENAVKSVMVVTKNALSKSLSRKIQNRFPAATIFYSIRETLSSKAHHEMIWLLLKSRESYGNSMVLGPFVRLMITSNNTTVKTSELSNYDISCWTEIVPVDKIGDVVTVNMKHYALEDPVRLHEVNVESSKYNREAVIRLSMSHQFVAQVDTTIQKITAKNTAKNTQVIYTIIPVDSDHVFQAVSQNHAGPVSPRFNTFESLATHIANLTSLSSVVAVIDFISNDITVAECKKRRDILIAAGFNKIVPWDINQLPIERFRSAENYDHGECTAVITEKMKKVFIRQNNNVKCLANIEYEEPHFDKFKVQTVHKSALMFVYFSFRKATQRTLTIYPHLQPLISQLWNTHWAIANSKNVVMANASLEFIIEGARRTAYKTGMVTLPHEFTIEIDVEAADNVKVVANCSPKMTPEEPIRIATFDTTYLHDRIIAVTITVKDMYNIAAKFKALAPGHQKRVITRIVLMRQLETGIDRQTFLRGDKTSVSDFALPSMLVALETYAHPELSAVIFITSGQNLNKYGRYVELARRFRFADIQICHEAVIETNRLLYGSDIDAEVGETMFIMNSSKYSKNFNKSYVIRKEANRFKLLKEEADTIENLRKEFPNVTRITFEGLNPINDHASTSPLHSYLFARVDGTLRRTAVDDIEMDINVTSSFIMPIKQEPTDEITFIFKFGRDEVTHKLKKDAKKNVVINVGWATEMHPFTRLSNTNVCHIYDKFEFLAVEGRKITVALAVDGSLSPTISNYTIPITFQMTTDNRIIVYNNSEDGEKLAEYPAYISFKDMTRRCGFDALHDKITHPENVAYDLHYMLSDQFDPQCPKKEWKFKTSLDIKNRIAEIDLGDYVVTPLRLLTELLTAILIKEQQKTDKVISNILFLVPSTFNLRPEQIEELGKALCVKMEIEYSDDHNEEETLPSLPISTSSKRLRNKKRCAIM